MASRIIKPHEPPRAAAVQGLKASAESLTPEELFLDDIRVSLQEIDEGHVLDSRRRIAQLQAELKHAQHDCYYLQAL